MRCQAAFDFVARQGFLEHLIAHVNSLQAYFMHRLFHSRQVLLGLDCACRFPCGFFIVVCQDEKNHYKEAAREAAGAVQTRQDLARMKKAVHEVSLQRVYMRNEMFKEPLTSDEIKSCL